LLIGSMCAATVAIVLAPSRDRIRAGTNTAHVSGPADLVVRKVGTNDFEQAIRGRTRRKEAHVLAVSAHQVDKAGVINHVDSPVWWQVFGIVSLVGIRYRANLFSCARETYEARMKCRNVSSQDARSIPFGIKRYKERLYILACGA
jgi:hypothetical protein